MLSLPAWVEGYAMELVIKSPEDAIKIFFSADEVDYSGLEKIVFEGWASTHIKIEGGFHSEINGPFLNAYANINGDLLRFLAIVRYDGADMRSLKQEDIDAIQYKVKVSEGSSDLYDNLGKILEQVSAELVGKMSGTEVVIAIVGLALIAAGYYGFTAWLEARRDARLEEVRAADRRQALESMNFASADQLANFNKVVDRMQSGNEAAQKALLTALNTNENILRAASQTPETVVAGNSIAPQEARELLGQTRRQAFSKIIEQEMRVIDVNTSDPISTKVIIENPENQQRLKVSFRDRMIDEAARAVLLSALDKRGNAWFRLSVRQVGDEITSVEILEVKQPSAQPAASTPSTAGRPAH